MRKSRHNEPSFQRLTSQGVTGQSPCQVMMGQGTDAVVAGFVQSLARPGGNFTGLSNLSTHLGGKRLELFKHAIPKLFRVAVLHDPAMPGNARELKDGLPPVASALGLTLQHWEVLKAEDFERIFDALNKERPDGLFYNRRRGAHAGARKTELLIWP